MDRPLEASLEKQMAEHSPIRVAMAGAGAVGRVLFRHLVDRMSCIQVSAIVEREWNPCASLWIRSVG
jgi:predicted homoserine dehydrogenase-like protein